MQDKEEKVVPTCPAPMDNLSAKAPTEAVTMDGIATLFQQQFGPITANINALNAGGAWRPAWTSRKRNLLVAASTCGKFKS